MNPPPQAQFVPKCLPAVAIEEEEEDAPQPLGPLRSQGKRHQCKEKAFQTTAEGAGQERKGSDIVGL